MINARKRPSGASVAVAAVALPLFLLAATGSSTSADGSSASRPDAAVPDDGLVPVEAVEGYACAEDHLPWLVDPVGLSVGREGTVIDGERLGDQDLGSVSVSHAWNGASLDVVLERKAEDVASALWGYETRLRITNDGSSLSASAAVAYRTDGTTPGGPPAAGTLSDLTGRVGIHADGWGEGAPVCLTLRLLGLRGDEPEWIQARVALR